MRADHPLTLTVEQAAEFLGIARSTAYELVRTGDIESIRLRRRIVVPTKPLAEKLNVSIAEVWASLTPMKQPFRPAAGPPTGPRGRSRAPLSHAALFDVDELAEAGPRRRTPHHAG